MTERLAPDFKTIEDFRRDNGQPIPAHAHLAEHRVHAY